VAQAQRPHRDPGGGPGGDRGRESLRSTFPVQSPVPPGWSQWTAVRILGISPIFWIGVASPCSSSSALPLHLGRPQVPGGGREPDGRPGGRRPGHDQPGHRPTWSRRSLYAVAGVALAGLIRTPGSVSASQYLLGPIAAVVIGGASLTGVWPARCPPSRRPCSSPGSTRTMRVMGLPTSLQFVVFGLVIIGGMLVSGDRIIKAWSGCSASGDGRAARRYPRPRDSDTTG
jgi:ribose transport system permease protein